MMFWKTTESDKETEFASNELSKACLDPERLAGHLTLALSKKTKSTSGHTHIYSRSRFDHIVCVWSKGALRDIAAKSPHCQKGQCVKWEESECSDYEPKKVLSRFYDDVSSIQMDGERLAKTSRSYSELIRWPSKNI